MTTLSPFLSLLNIFICPCACSPKVTSCVFACCVYFPTLCFSMSSQQFITPKHSGLEHRFPRKFCQFNFITNGLLLNKTQLTRRQIIFQSRFSIHQTVQKRSYTLDDPEDSPVWYSFRLTCLQFDLLTENDEYKRNLPKRLWTLYRNSFTPHITSMDLINSMTSEQNEKVHFDCWSAHIC